MYLSNSDLASLAILEIDAVDTARDVYWEGVMADSPEDSYIPAHDWYMHKARQLRWLSTALRDKRSACPEGGYCTRGCSPEFEACSGFSCIKQYIAHENTDVHDNHDPIPF